MRYINLCVKVVASLIVIKIILIIMDFILLDEERYRQYIKASQFCSKEQPSKKSANKDITNVKLIKWIKKY